MANRSPTGSDLRDRDHDRTSIRRPGVEPGALRGHRPLN
jgi:hypothetical protein